MTVDGLSSFQSSPMVYEDQVASPLGFGRLMERLDFFWAVL
jgi:hypothetical protein